MMALHYVSSYKYWPVCLHLVRMSCVLNVIIISPCTSVQPEIIFVNSVMYFILKVECSIVMVGSAEEPQMCAMGRTSCGREI
jgi:hypothetical protein